MDKIQGKASADLLAAIDSGYDRPLSVTTEHVGVAVVLSVRGEVDMFNAQTWQQLLAEAADLASAPGPLIVDANEADFMAMHAYVALVEQSRHCRRRGLGLRLVSGQRTVARALGIGGWNADLPLYPDVDAALNVTPS